MARVLVVDDAAFMRMMIKDILTKNGFEVIGEAPNGLRAIEIYKVEKPDIVTMDITMPEMDGISASKLIRKYYPDLPIIAQTAFIFNDDKDIILEAGCDACLIKPIRKEHLLTVMSNFLKSS